MNRSVPKTRWIVLALLLVLSMLFAACAAPATAPAPEAPPPAEEQAAVEEEVVEEPAVEEEAVEEEEVPAEEEAVEEEAEAAEATRLVIAQSVDVQGLEPSEVSSRPEDNIFRTVFGTLFEINNAGEIGPYLAESYSLSEDGTEWTFTLNEGLTCHDGEPLTAEDVVYTFERAADPENAFTGNTAGFVLDALKYAGARVDGELEATIITEAYSAIGLGLISEVYIHCKDYYEGLPLEEAAINPVGSGPYKFVEWVKDDHVLVEKWDEFTLRESFFDEIEWKVIPEASTRAAELIAGNVHIITNVAPDQVDAINASGTAEVEGVAGTRRMYVGFNQRDIFDDTEGGRAIKETPVRVALQYAVDVPTICQQLLSFDCERASSMVNPPNDNPDLEPYPYDPAKAEELLDAAGYPRGEDGVRFEIVLQAGRGRYLNDVAVVQAIGQYLSDVGVQTDVQILDWSSEFVPALIAHDTGPLYFVGSGGATWNAQYDMADLSEPTGATNYTEWANPEWFELWNSLPTIFDPAEQKVVTDQMLEIFYNDPPWLFLYFQPDFYGVSNLVDWEPPRDEMMRVYPATLK